MTKEDLIQYINNKYQRMEKLLKDVAEDCEDSLRPMLEACVKLFWLVKYDKEPVWANNNRREEFNLQKAIDSEKFSMFFSPFIISDMHSIRLLGNKTVHPNVQRLNANEISELVDRLRRIIKEMEKVLGFSIIKFIQEEGSLPNTDTPPLEKMIDKTFSDHPLLNKSVRSITYGEGKIIKIIGNKMTVQFANHQEEYTENSFKNGILRLIGGRDIQVEQNTTPTASPKEQGINPITRKTVFIDQNKPPFKSISKYEAIRLFKNNGLNIISSHCTFASKNSTSYVYWANPKTDLLEDDWWLILNDNISYKIHLFKIPANVLDLDMIKVRADKQYLIDLQILFDDNSYTDTRSNIRFAKWHIKTLTY